jgi:twitching motility protein PilI
MTDQATTELIAPVGSTTDGSAVTNVPTIDRQGYRIGALQLLTRFEDASELLALPLLYRVPGAAREIVGIANLHGNIAPVFSLHERLQQKVSADVKQMVLVLGHGDARAGVLIDGLPVRKKFSPDQAADINQVANFLQDYTWAAFQQDDGLWIDFDYASVLNELSVNA